jgi:hypothetical protein
MIGPASATMYTSEEVTSILKKMYGLKYPVVRSTAAIH